MATQTETGKMTFSVTARRLDAHGSEALCKEARLVPDTDESDHRLELLHENVRKYGTVYNTVAPGTSLQGEIRRK